MALFEPGTHVGGARIVRVLGSGTVATVYEALHDGARRALKIIDGTLDSPKARERFAQEGEATAMIEHVNVVRWFGCGMHDGDRPWILLELVEGPNLRDLLRRSKGRRLPVERALTIMRHVCEGLSAVHKKKIIHRDMKPENILVAADDLAKVGDFGSAKLPGWGVKTTTAHRLTSMAYMPPEIWRGTEPDERADVYACGIILYESITGTNPIVPKVADVLAMCAAHLQHEPQPLAVAANVSTRLSDLVQKAMAKDAAQRCTMRELADGLEEELDRLLVWRRAAARSLPLPNREPGLALTAPMSASASPAKPEAPHSPVLSSSAPQARRGFGGTMRMEVAPASTGSDDRTAAPPPAPTPSAAATPGAPPSGAVSTLRTPSRPLPAAPAGAVELDGARRTTGIPVESTGRPSMPRASTASPRRRILQLAVAGCAFVALGIAVWWTLLGTERRTTPKPAAPPPAVSASASLPPAPSASLARPSSSASGTPTRPARRPQVPVAPHR